MEPGRRRQASPIHGLADVSRFLRDQAPAGHLRPLDTRPHCLHILGHANATMASDNRLDNSRQSRSIGGAVQGARYGGRLRRGQGYGIKAGSIRGRLCREGTIKDWRGMGIRDRGRRYQGEHVLKETLQRKSPHRPSSEGRRRQGCGTACAMHGCVGGPAGTGNAALASAPNSPRAASWTPLKRCCLPAPQGAQQGAAHEALRWAAPEWGL